MKKPQEQNPPDNGSIILSEMDENLDEHKWELGLEHLQNVLDGVTRPIAWSSSNPILLAHPHLPQILGRLFQGNPLVSPPIFEIPNPPTIQLTPLYYAPPTIISLSPDDSLLFAYFPPSIASSADGLACVWQCRGVPSSWSVKEVWPVKRGHGIVACRWLGERREWYLDKAGNAQRRCRSSPISLRRCAFILVTESLQVNLVFRPDGRRQQPNFSSLRASITMSSATYTGAPELPEDVRADSGGSVACLKASIGFGDGDETAIVAYRTSLLPPLNSSSYSAPIPLNDLSARPGEAEPTPDLPLEAWGEENSIKLCEIRLQFLPDVTTLETFPAPPIPVHQSPPSSHPDVSLSANEGWTLTERVAHLNFVMYTPSEDPSLRSTTTGTEQHDTSQPTTPPSNPTSEIFLLCSTLDLGQGILPKSHIRAWRLVRSSSPQGSLNPAEEVPQATGHQPPMSSYEWMRKLVYRKTFENQAIAFISATPGSLGEGVLFGVLDLSGTIASGELEATIGRVHHLVIPFSNGTEGTEGEGSVVLTCHRHRAGKSPPTSIAISPNRRYAVTLGGETTAHTMSLFELPAKSTQLPVLANNTPHVTKVEHDQVPFEGSESPETPSPLIQSLAASVILGMTKGAEQSDSLRSFWSTREARKAGGLYQLIKCVSALWQSPKQKFQPESHNGGKSGGAGGVQALDDALGSVEFEVIAFAFGLQRAGPNSGPSQAVPPILQLRAINTAFEEISTYALLPSTKRHYESPSLDRLVAYTSVTVELCEAIVKEAVLEEAWSLCNSPENGAGQEPIQASILLILLHPYLNNLLSEVLAKISGLQEWMAKRQEPLGKAMATIFKEAKVDMKEFRVALADVRKLSLKRLAELPALRDALNKSVLSLVIFPTLRDLLHEVTSLLNSRPALSQRLALMVPSLEAFDSDGFAPGPSNTQSVDVITRQGIRDTAIVRVCLRCEGRSEPSGSGYSTWAAYERHWQGQCICGGTWNLRQPEGLVDHVGGF